MLIDAYAAKNPLEFYNACHPKIAYFQADLPIVEAVRALCHLPMKDIHVWFNCVLAHPDPSVAIQLLVDLNNRQNLTPVKLTVLQDWSLLTDLNYESTVNLLQDTKILMLQKIYHRREKISFHFFPYYRTMY